jgi:hypothetical protein
LPCGLVQLPYVILNPAKQEWIPRDIDLQTWRVISWPLVAFARVALSKQFILILILQPL